MTPAARGFGVLSVILTLLVVLLVTDRERATAKAEALAEELERTDAVRVALADSLTRVIAARDTVRDTLIVRVGTATVGADREVHARAAQADSLEAVLSELTTRQRSTIEEMRASFQREVDSLRTALTAAVEALDLELATRRDLEDQLVRAEAQIARALRTVRAQRSTTRTRLGQALQLVGVLTLGDRAVCGLLNTQLFLPCGAS